MIALRLDGYQHEIGLKNQARRSPGPSFLCHHSFEKAKESFESTSGVSNKETHWHFVDCSYMLMQAGLFKTLDRSWLIYIPHWWMTRMDNTYTEVVSPDATTTAPECECHEHYSGVCRRLCAYLSFHAGTSNAKLNMSGQLFPQPLYRQRLSHPTATTKASEFE